MHFDFFSSYFSFSF